MTQKTIQATTDVATPPAAFDAAWEPVRLLELGLRVPAGTSFRLDQPCAYSHGSLGGWLRDDDGELTFTLLWRPLGYWSAAAGRVEDLDSLQATFVDKALARTRRDGHRVTVLEKQETPLVGAGHHGTLIDIAIEVRRHLNRVRLRRRQALWTCPETRRHLAFEMSARSQEADRIGPCFTAVLPSLSCHRGFDGPADD